MKRQPRSSPRSGKPRRTVSIIGTGSYVPEKILTNADLSQDGRHRSDEWITTRTGIKERRIAAEDEYTSDMATKAALAAIEQAGISAEEIDLILLATATPDMLFPATACLVQTKIGATKAACLDVSAACAGFLFAVEIAQQFITSHTYETVLVIGAEKLSSITNWTDRNTCVLFGDGAGAAILRHRGGGARRDRHAHGQRRPIRRHPFHAGRRLPHAHHARKRGPESPNHPHVGQGRLQAGRDRHAGRVARKSSTKPGSRSTTSPASFRTRPIVRIIEAIADRLKIPLERFYVNLDRYGNTSAAAVAIALDEANRTGRIKAGDYVLMVVFGGGLTWASTVIEW